MLKRIAGKRRVVASKLGSGKSGTGAGEFPKGAHPATAEGFAWKKSIEELAAEQGVRLEGQLQRILGAGADLWESDEEFERFVQGIAQRRGEDRQLDER